MTALIPRNSFLILLISILLLFTASYGYALNSSEVEGELMCNCGCGDVLVNCACDESVELRSVIGKMIDEGRSKDEIVDAFVARYGEVILSAPPKSGFNLLAYIVPFIGLLLGLTIFAWFILKWSRATPSVVLPEGQTSELDHEMEERIKGELDDIEEDY